VAGHRSLDAAGLLNAPVRAHVASGGRLLILAVIGASLLYFPAALLVVLFFAALGVPFETVLTIGGWLGVLSGMLAWWLLLFAVVLPCALLLLPWNVRLDGFRRLKDK
jgi:hypothetical protein